MEEVMNKIKYAPLRKVII